MNRVATQADADLGRHLETVIGSSPWLKGIPGLMLLVFGVGAVVAYVIDPPALREPGREPIRYVVLGLGVFCALAGGLAFWYFALAGERAAFDAFEDGFACVHRGRTLAVRWDDVAGFSVHHAVDENYLAFLAFIVKVDLKDGTVLRFGKDDFGVSGVYTILDHVHRGVGKLRAQALLPRLDKNETVELTPFDVNRGGFSWQSESLAWPDIKDFTTSENLIQIHLKDGTKIRTEINSLECPNYCVLRALAQHYRR
jgi:hypothetical protein